MSQDIRAVAKYVLNIIDMLFRHIIMLIPVLIKSATLIICVALIGVFSVICVTIYGNKSFEFTKNGASNLNEFIREIQRPNICQWPRELIFQHEDYIGCTDVMMKKLEIFKTEDRKLHEHFLEQNKKK